MEFKTRKTIRWRRLTVSIAYYYLWEEYREFETRKTTIGLRRLTLGDRQFVSRTTTYERNISNLKHGKLKSEGDWIWKTKFGSPTITYGENIGNSKYRKRKGVRRLTLGDRQFASRTISSVASPAATHTDTSELYVMKRYFLSLTFTPFFFILYFKFPSYVVTSTWFLTRTL